MKRPNPVAKECGVASAHYVAGPDGRGLELRYYPTFFCECGWNTEYALDWEEAGATYDAHLEQMAVVVKPAAKVRT